MLALPQHKPNYIIGCDCYDGECHIIVTKIIDNKLVYENQRNVTSRNNP